jgi:hypothetical protein|tara:strand:+ start:2294 stop:2785 length:492 start_codon:yes stop_codon:yes gene_type:complete
MTNYIKEREFQNKIIDRENIEKIVALACRLGDITKEELLSTSRTRLIGDVRMCVGNLLRRVFGLTTIETGKYLNRDHSTILHYEREHASLLMLNYYKKIYNKCFKAAESLSEMVEEIEYNQDDVIKELKKENNMLYRKVEDLKMKISKYKKLQVRLQSLHDLL